MRNFRSLQAKHEQLLQHEDGSNEFLAEVMAYIDQVKTASSEIFLGREREQLRANLRYWASYVYEHSADRSYPNIELQTLSANASRRQRLHQLGRLSSVIVMIAAIFLLWFTVRNLVRSSLPTPAAIILPRYETPTQMAVLLKTASPTITIPPTPISPTPSPGITTTPTLPGGDPEAKSVRLHSPKEGEMVIDEVEFSGTFSNQQAGWTIHVIVQPLSQGGRIFPLRKSFPILEPSGDWVITDKIVVGDDLSKPETYIIRVVVASDPETRLILEAAASEGLDQLPSGAGEYGQPITVTREAVQAIRETRIVFTYIDPVLLLPEVYSIRPDPANLDFRRLTIMPLYGEIQPVVAPDGQSLAFLTRVKDQQDNRVFNLFTVGLGAYSDPQAIAAAPERGIVFDDPVWSPDGSYIAFSRGEPLAGSTSTFYRLAVYDLQEGKLRILWTGTSSSRYPFWIDGRTLGYSTRVEGSFGFMSIGIDTGETAVFFDTAANEQWGRLSPDGRYLAYLVPFGERFGHDVFVVDLQGDRQPVRLTDDNYQDQSPQWDPDGSTIYYISFATDPPSIRAIGRDGSNLREIFRGEVGIDHISVGQLNVWLPLGP